MGWRAEYDKAESGHVLLALLLMRDPGLLAELERRGLGEQRVRQVLADRLGGRAAQKQATTSAGFISEAVAAGRLKRDALVRSVLADYWGVAGQVLREAAAGAGGRAGREPLVRLDDGSGLTIYEQIIAQVREGIATGRLRPGERLPTVRELADQLGIAPGTVARAYSELERQNVVVTQGMRGTRVAERPAAAATAMNRPEVLPGMLRPAVVAAFHLGASAEQLRAALDAAMRDIYPPGSPPQA
jgi:GntR family transcriptional regulator